MLNLVHQQPIVKIIGINVGYWIRRTLDALLCQLLPEQTMLLRVFKQKVLEALLIPKFDDGKPLKVHDYTA